MPFFGFYLNTQALSFTSEAKSPDLDCIASVNNEPMGDVSPKVTQKDAVLLD